MAEDLLPNCLTREPKVVWQHSTGMVKWFAVYCANCGDEVARVMDTMLPAQYAFALCNTCVEKHGEPYGFTRTPDDVWRTKCINAMIETYGRVLSDEEILQKLKDRYSVISKLEKEGQQRRL